MREIDLTSDELIAILFCLNERERVCVLDSSGVGHLGSHLLIAGVRPRKVEEIHEGSPNRALQILDEVVAGELAAIFTLSYDFGLKLLKVSSIDRGDDEPDVFLALFDVLIVHDYDTRRTFLAGHEASFKLVLDLLGDVKREATLDHAAHHPSCIRSNFTRAEYVTAVEYIREHIRDGNTYQANLTQQLIGRLAEGLTPETIFLRLRHDHPAPFAAFVTRDSSTVVSASPERFFRVLRDRSIEASPIKGTRPRGATVEDDDRLRNELISSEKDRAENTMIVDLMRNDLGRVCEFGSVHVAKLCDLEEHPTLFHLVSTVRGQLRPEAKMSDILTALFPCGSITGAPKIRTMQILDELEPASRGLSMGAVGIFIPPAWDLGDLAFDTLLDLSVAIRTMVIRDRDVIFNVGGGVVIDSDAEKEYDESLLKAKALLQAIDAQEI